MAAGFRGSQYTQNVPPVKTVPEFWTFDAMAKYAITPRVNAQVNVNNLTNRYYYEQLHFFHVVPGEGRTALLTLQGAFLTPRVDHSRAVVRSSCRRVSQGARGGGVGRRQGHRWIPFEPYQEQHAAPGRTPGHAPSRRLILEGSTSVRCSLLPRCR